MAKLIFKKSTVILCVFALTLSGCANTIPSRAKRAAPVHATALYPVRTAVIAFTDARPEEHKRTPKKITWPDWTGRIDYYGENLGSGLSTHITEYLRASHVFSEVQNMEFLQSDTSLKSLGYRAVLIGRITSFNASIEVPKWVLVLAVTPIPLFGLTLVPIVVWPKKVGFEAVLEDLRLKDLETGQVYNLDKIEISKFKKGINLHFFPRWYLGELAEKISKDLVSKLQRAQIRF